MIARDQQPTCVRALSKLDPDSRTCSHPHPIRFRCRGTDVLRLRPSLPIVGATRDMNGLVILRERQPNRTVLGILDRTRISNGDLFRTTRFMHDLMCRPGSTAVDAALHQQIYVTMIARAGFASFAECQYGAFGSRQQRGYAIRVISVFPCCPQRGCFQERRSRMCIAEPRSDDQQADKRCCDGPISDRELHP